MVQIKPLRGLVYNKEKISDFSGVITPPNDVISEKEKGELKKKSEFNFVRLILPDSNGNKYRNAAKLFGLWQKQEIFVRDKDEAIYIYSQSYKIKSKVFSRTGFISLIELEQLGKGVLPHEKILEKDLQDRIALISATKANFGIPFLLYDDREKIIDDMILEEIKSKEPFISFLDKNKVTHSLWRISNAWFIKKITAEMHKYQCIIADGHHRYTSELKVKETLGERYGLMCFVNSFNDGMVILPTNRVVYGLRNLDNSFFLNQLRRYFEIEEFHDINEVVKRLEKTPIMIDKSINLKNHLFGIHNNLNKKAYLLRLKDIKLLDKLIPSKTDIYKKLDINILHKIIIEQILGITEEQQRNREHIDFIKGNQETIEKMEDKSLQFAFFVSPPLMREVFLTARANETMPQKSTYFFPKVYSGLVVYKFEEG